ncbi:OPT oligopeptide transporter protein-domain-containing protein [Yarrowia lipolytica]|uniref:OPT oligopeptide transporter protein-domain-containing protein n=1 Tax=Yarrowia lipolytica TaxID=4952 RepID=A0A371C2K4_YARLL|nr:OPT oligopeptide transporter protein-domain-containing protein [Yarrowia lipolytica]RDW29328.1 OPT oligopeptide transporter protein-domain-containing protein [Yarrowia lipolytica]RDW50058.1 OPT oligopeptide transporter protein-domain-containing protein [Yarrowia lipolytica]
MRNVNLFLGAFSACMSGEVDIGLYLADSSSDLGFFVCIYISISPVDCTHSSHPPTMLRLKLFGKEKSSEEEVETEIGEVLDVSDVPEISEIPPDVTEYVAQQLGTPPNDVDGSYPADVLFMAEKFLLMSENEAIEICTRNLKYHEFDPNFRDSHKDLLAELLKSFNGSGDPDEAASDEKDEKDEKDELDPLQKSMLLRFWATLFHWWSPYPEVRAVTDPFDDDSQTCLTWRVLLLGTIWVGVGAFVNQFFDPRLPAITLSASVCQLLLYPSGRLLQYCLPDWGFSIRGHRFTLNPGEWSQKEQLLATVMVNCANGTPYVAENIFIQYMPMFYNQKWAGGFGYGFLLMLVTQFMGFGLAGLLRRVGVYPVMAMWPSILPTLAVNKALLAPNRKESINGWTITRYHFFFLVFLASFLYFWIPNYLWTAISTWNWMTWIAPNNADLAIVTGSISGMGYNPIPTFDWNMMNMLISPILTPLYSSMNQYVGMFVSGLFILAVFYTNNNYTKWLPINDNTLYDNTGNPFDVTKILTNFIFDESKYKKYSPPYYSAANLVLYGAFFALYPMAFVYSVLCYWKQMGIALRDTWLSLRYIHRSNYEGLDDAFSRIQKKHKEVPDWWFYAILLIMFGLSIALVEHWPTDTPVWVIVLCLGMCLVFLLPFTIFYSISGVLLTLNVLGELIIGYALPGKFQALNTTKALMVQIADQAMNYTTDQKTTHYAHLPPRSIFMIQLWATLVNGLVCLGVLQFQMFSVKEICTKHNSMKFSCPNENTLFSASVIWGVIGPKRIFDHQYPVLKWMFLLGAGVGLLFWAFQYGLPMVLVKRYPASIKKILRYQRIVTKAHPLILCSAMLSWAPYNLSYMTGGFYLAILFNWYLKTRYLEWWRKYAYVFSSGMDTGVALSAIVIFFAVEYNDYGLSWWGNNVSSAGVDGQGIPIPPLPDVGYFGPGPDHYP